MRMPLPCNTIRGPVATACRGNGSLRGLCAAFEHESHPGVLKAMNRWLSSNPAIRKPELPARRGAMTIAEVHATAKQSDVAYSAAVQRWARCAWEAYAELHPQARAWVAAALGDS